MLKKLSSLGRNLCGIDPIWKGREHEADASVKVVGKFVEDLNPKEDLGGQPDLVVSSHTFEHINEPRAVLGHLMDIAAPGAIFAIEVPGFDTLVEINRFDQVFHQHIHYYSLSSFLQLIHELGGSYMSHTFNYDYWGGTMLVVFQKGGDGSNAPKDIPLSQDLIQKSLQRFRDQLSVFSEIIDSQKRNSIYAYGAAQMLPTLAYHLKTDFSWCQAVLDDDPKRNGKMYPHMAVKIEKPEDSFSLKDSTVFISALDSVRPILKRIIAMNAKRIVCPLALL